MDLEKLIKEANEFGMSQHYAEIIRLARFLGEEQPTNCIEIGTYKGGTFYILCALCKGIKITVDMPLGGFGGKHLRTEDAREARNKMVESFDGEAHMLMMDSHSGETYDAIKKILGRKKVGFLFIDADHSYEGVKQDYEMYSPLVRKGGLIALHDIADTRKHARGHVEVPRFWKELEGDKEEIICGASWGGIGIIRKK